MRQNDATAGLPAPTAGKPGGSTGKRGFRPDFVDGAGHRDIVPPMGYSQTPPPVPENPYAAPMTVVAAASDNERSAFYQRTYLHVAGAVAAFAALEAIWLKSPLAPAIAQKMTGGFSWLIVLGLFMVVGFIADKWAQSSNSKTMQYAGLGLYVVAQSVIFLPLMLYANAFAPGAIVSAAWTTAALVAGITIFAFVSGKDFSFLRGVLVIGGLIALGTIVAAILFNFALGVWFSGAMALFAAVSVLYTTSSIIHHYNPRQYVAASLALFSGIALMFWYILQLFLSFNQE